MKKAVSKEDMQGGDNKNFRVSNGGRDGDMYGPRDHYKGGGYMPPEYRMPGGQCVDLHGFIEKTNKLSG